MLPVMGKEELPTESVEAEEDKKDSEKKTSYRILCHRMAYRRIYGYLHKNYEEKGLNDAMVKSDLAFRDMNMGIARNKILMIFRRNQPKLRCDETRYRDTYEHMYCCRC